MKVYFATDHAGFNLKEVVKELVSVELKYEVQDFGAYELESSDDYPDYIHKAAMAVSDSHGADKAIIFGGSGQGEAMVANRYRGVRAAVYYGDTSANQEDEDSQVLDIVSSTRMHNDANVLSLGARFLTADQAKEAVKMWLTTDFSAEDRHIRRINKIDHE